MKLDIDLSFIFRPLLWRTRLIAEDRLPRGDVDPEQFEVMCQTLVRTPGNFSIARECCVIVSLARDQNARQSTLVSVCSLRSVCCLESGERKRYTSIYVNNAVNDLANRLLSSLSPEVRENRFLIDKHNSGRSYRLDNIHNHVHVQAEISEVLSPVVRGVVFRNLPFTQQRSCQLSSITPS